MTKDKKKKEKKLSKTEELEIKAAEHLAGWKKALADYQNLQKESDKRLSGMADFTTNTFILELLPVFDNYRTAIKHIPEDQQKESWAVGLEHILKMWQTFLDDHKIERIKTADQKFDPYWHEAVGEVNEDGQDDQIIIEEKLAGYKLKDVVIRPAKVIINNHK
jgi:molecular chaperone GrpE